MSRRKRLLQYLVIYPFFNVAGMAIGTALLFIVFSWTIEYAKVFFYISSAALIIIFYVLNFFTIVQALMSGNVEARNDDL